MFNWERAILARKRSRNLETDANWWSLDVRPGDDTRCRSASGRGGRPRIGNEWSRSVEEGARLKDETIAAPTLGPLAELSGVAPEKHRGRFGRTALTRDAGRFPNR